ncbi:MAG TPA: alpha/beta hydrolase [Gammaproteobacteria bacterium]|nr:alpha/beta hydrolase [Gammaproteobacteria bacterium]
MHLEQVRLHYVTAGYSPGVKEAVVLLHGWPQSWYEWRHLMPELATGGRTVVAVDLRGLGDSSKPAGGFDKKTLADDVAQLLHQLGLERVVVVGHDWGGAVAAALALQYRQLIIRLVLLDIVIPGIPLPGIGDGLAGYWHMQFHQVADLPEALVQGREAVYISWFFNNFAFNPAAFNAADIAEYTRCASQPGALRCGFGYYRCLQEDAQFFSSVAEQKLGIPVLALGGEQSIGAGVKLCAEQFATNVEGGVVEQCGHWIPEERPVVLLEWLNGFIRFE